MSYIDINAYNCTCERCHHVWSAFNLPRTCSSCRSPYWDVPKGTEKKSVAASPIVVNMTKTEVVSTDKKTELDGLRAIMEAVQIKPKAEPHPDLPVYPKATDWEEPSIS